MIVEFGGMQPVLSVGYSNSTLTPEQEADAFTVVAGMTIRDGGSLASFQDNAVCLNRVETAVASRPKYQSMDGYGNNLAHPFWGNAETPFGRFGPKNYADGIHSLRKSDRTSLDLPSPREIVDKVLNKVKITQRTSKKLNSLFLQLIVALAHDVGHFSPVDPLNKAQRIGCCLPGNKAEIPGHSRHSACIPIEVPKDDEFYKKSETTCIGLVRSQMVSTPSGVQFGEIKNKASSFADLSVVYGANIDESNKVRSFSQGKLLLTPGQTLPVDSAGQFTAIAGRLNIVITANSWSVFFIRNHNNIAERLAVLNPAWNDEKVFQEARKINIAIYQNIATSKTVTENIFGSFVNEGYKEDVDPSETVEFHSTVTRCTHFLIPSTLRLLESNGQFTDTLQSDLIGRVDILDGQTESYIRGAMNQSIFDEYYSDEVRRQRSQTVLKNLIDYLLSFVTNCSRDQMELASIFSQLTFSEV